MKKPTLGIKYCSIGVNVTHSGKEKNFKYSEWITGNPIFKLNLLLLTNTWLSTDA